MSTLLQRLDARLPFTKSERIIICIVLILHALPALEFIHLSSRPPKMDDERVMANFPEPSQSPKAPAPAIQSKPKEEPKKKIEGQKPPQISASPKAEQNPSPQSQQQTKSDASSQGQMQNTPVAPSTSGSISSTPIFTDIGKLEILFAPDAEGYYPSFSKRACEQGAVEVGLLINQLGEVDNIIMIKSSNYPKLDRAASQLAQRYRFKPFSPNGTPISTNTKLKVVFSLKGCQ